MKTLIQKVSPILLMVSILLGVALTSNRLTYPFHSYRGWTVFEWGFPNEDSPRCVGSFNDKEGVLFLTAAHCLDDNDNGKLDEWEIKRILEINGRIVNLQEGEHIQDRDIFIIRKPETKIDFNVGEVKRVQFVSSVYGRKIEKGMNAFVIPNRDVWWLPKGVSVLVLQGNTRRGMSGSPVFQGNRLVGILVGGDGYFSYASPITVSK